MTTTKLRALLHWPGQSPQWVVNDTEYREKIVLLFINLAEKRAKIWCLECTVLVKQIR